jgi:FAD/FMN-containing dehydrogenase
MDTRALREELDGDVITAEDHRYEAAAATFAGSGAPDIIVRPVNDADVAVAVRFARDNALAVGIRGGGHGSWGVAVGGLVLDLSALADVKVEGDLVHVGGGSVWGTVAQTIRTHGLALSSGDTGSVGVGGNTLGGGIGWMVRLWGLALDQLTAAHLVTASGEALDVSATEHPDLFWALRGGGGNFGVVTRFTFQAHPLPGVCFGVITLEPATLPAALRKWRDIMRTAPRRLGVTFAWESEGPQLQICYADDNLNEANTATAPLLRLPGATSAGLAIRAYADLLKTPPELPVGANAPTITYSNGFATELTDEIIDQLLDYQKIHGAGLVEIRYLAGYFSDINAAATAIAHRSAEAFLLSITISAPHSTTTDIENVVDLWRAGVGDRLGGTYGNFIPTDTPEVLARIYPDATLDRLREVKTRWDPHNLFSRNHNIQPLGT